MSVITTINASDLITNSRTDINNNFANLNSGKIETSVLDTDTSLAANSDAKIATQKAVKAYVDAGGNVNASTTVKGIVEEATAAEIVAGAATGGTGARLFVNPSTLLGVGVKYGGTGADGALAISSGITTIALGGVAVFEKNYSSISITGTGSLAFSGPAAGGTIIILKCSGAITLTSSITPMINISNTGAAGGAAVAVSSTTSANGNAGTDGYSSTGTVTGAIATTSAANTAGVYTIADAFPLYSIINRYPRIGIGSGGASGYIIAQAGSGTLTGGAGGRGAGALIIECAGTFTFTTANGLSIVGTPGTNASTSGFSTSDAGGGGGGGNGTLIITYVTAGTITGTVTTTGAAGGNGASAGSPSAARGGGSGASQYASGTAGGGPGTAPQGGSATTVANYLIDIVH